jgi:hypothetical protein
MVYPKSEAQTCRSARFKTGEAGPSDLRDTSGIRQNSPKKKQLGTKIAACPAMLRADFEVATTIPACNGIVL